LQLPKNIENYVLTFKLNIIKSRMQEKKNIQSGNFGKRCAPNKQ